MGRKYKGLLVPVHGAMREVWYEDYRDIQMVIGCSCFTVMPWLFGDEPACYIDDEGKITPGVEPNRAIFDDDGRPLDIVFGNMLFGGVDMSTGESRDITDAEIKKVKDRFGKGREGEGSGMALCNLLQILDSLE